MFVYLELVDKIRSLYKSGSEFFVERFKVKYIARSPASFKCRMRMQNVEYNDKTLFVGAVLRNVPLTNVVNAPVVLNVCV